MDDILQPLQPHDPYEWGPHNVYRTNTIKNPAGVHIFHIRDKVESTKAHDEHFGSHLKGIVEKVDNNYLEVRIRTDKTVVLHSKWMKPFDGELLFFYKGKLV